MHKQVLRKSIYGMAGLFSAVILANTAGSTPQPVQAAVVPASSLTVSSSVNAYIANNRLQPAGITTELHDFELFNYSTADGKPNGVVFHYTDNPNNFSARNEADYEINGGWVNAFVHTFIDANTILNIHDIGKGSWGAGYQANQRFVQFELVTARNSREFAQSVNNAAYYVAYLAHHFGWNLKLASANAGIGTLWTHYDVSMYLGGTNHVDPIAYLNKWGYNTTQFYDLVKAHYNNREEFPAYSILSSKTVSRKAKLNQSSRSDGLFIHGPYKTSANTAKPDANAKAYNGQTVTVTKEATTQTGTWNYITLSNGKKYWVDKRGLTTLYNPVSNYRKQNYIAKVTQGTRNDGLFTGGPWMTNAASEDAAGNAKAYNNQFVTVTASETTKSLMSGGIANWNEIRLANGKTYWMDARGVTKVNFYSITGRTSVNKVATFNQGTRNDGLFIYGPYLTSAQTLTPTTSAKAYNQQPVTIFEEAKTPQATWAHVRLNDGKTYWVDMRGLSVVNLYRVTDKKAASGVALINQTQRSDGLFAAGPYKTSVSTLKPDAAASAYRNQGVTIIATAKTGTATWNQIRLTNGKTYWIDARGLQTVKLDPITNKTTANTAGVIDQSKRNDGLFATGPYKTSVTALKPSQMAKGFHQQPVTIIAIAKTPTATWNQIRLTNGQTYWIDARGVKAASFYAITSSAAANRDVQVNQAGRHDGLFAAGPYKTNAQTLAPNASAAAYNGQYGHVTQTAKTATGTWNKVTFNDGKTYWIDERGVQPATYYQVSDYRAQNGIATINQASRNDGLFSGGPYRTSAQTMTPSANAKAYHQQTVQVLATEKTAMATWAQIRLANGRTYWIDARGLTMLAPPTTVNLTVAQRAFLDKITPAVKTVAKANGLYPSVMSAQAIIESAWGTSELAVQANNFFGIKATADWHGATYTKVSNEHVNGQVVPVASAFRKYATAQDGFADYAKKIKTSPFYTGTWRQNAPDGVTAAGGLQKWATDPGYTAKIANAIKTYGLSSLDY